MVYRQSLQYNKMLQWLLILSITLISTALMMFQGEYIAILPQAQRYFQTSRTMVLLLLNSFCIFYILISPFIFHIFNKHYFWFVIVSTVATALAFVGRYFAADHYGYSLAMATVLAIAHISVISAPYGLLKLFPEWQRGYASSIPLFLPFVGINLSILYDLVYIAQQGNSTITEYEVYQRIHTLDGIIALIAVVSCTLTVILMMVLRHQIQEEEEQEQENLTFLQSIITYSKDHKLTFITLICWGSIVGTNWTYCGIFGVMFEGHGYTQKQIALLGLVGNVTVAVSSNLGTLIKNRFGASNISIISIINIIGLAAAVLLMASRHIVLLSNLTFVIVLMVLVQIGFCSFTSLAFLEMQQSGIPSVVISGLFFWVANAVHLLGMELLDLVQLNISNLIIVLIVAVCIVLVEYAYCTYPPNPKAVEAVQALQAGESLK